MSQVGDKKLEDWEFVVKNWNFVLALVAVQVVWVHGVVGPLFKQDFLRKSVLFDIDRKEVEKASWELVEFQLSLENLGQSLWVLL